MQELQHKQLLKIIYLKKVLKNDLGREIESVDWKEESGGIILDQLKNLAVHVTGRELIHHG